MRAYWDGEASPSVEVRVADFFGMGFGEWQQFVSLPLNMTSGGFKAYWPMPFHRSARITVEPTGPLSLGSVELQRGANELVLEIVGKDVRSAGYSDGYLVGIDGFMLYR